MNFEKRLFNKVVLVFFMVILMSAIGSFNTGIAEAKSVEYKITGISLKNGKCIINGYFHNYGNAGATVRRVLFQGTIHTSAHTSRPDYLIDHAFDILDVGFISAGSKKNRSFTINSDMFSFYNGNIKWEIYSYII